MGIKEYNLGMTKKTGIQNKSSKTILNRIRSFLFFIVPAEVNDIKPKHIMYVTRRVFSYLNVNSNSGHTTT